MGNFPKFKANSASNIAENSQSEGLEVLTLKDTASLCGMSVNYLRKLTSQRMIPHYKPNGKMIYFNKREVIDWLLRNRVQTRDEIRKDAEAYCRKGGSI